MAVEPIDQAPAEVPSLADILATPDFTQFLLNDPHAPMVTMSLEEQALAPARTLVRVPYLEHLLALVMCNPLLFYSPSCNVAVTKLTFPPPLSLPSPKHMLTWPLTWLPSSWAYLTRYGWHSFQKRLLTTAALVIPRW